MMHLRSAGGVYAALRLLESGAVANGTATAPGVCLFEANGRVGGRCKFRDILIVIFSDLIYILIRQSDPASWSHLGTATTTARVCTYHD